ncbi:L-rhamnose mutarotase [Paenibacillus cellulosilyticus]|uniref:L-rhamnose mutarotase n=1 Tax=Paenibacillus cellulosilyticus TaxID=375489 RepID=A0A2V2YQC1_9BACL|nr:L-rhamnose mutarotase [Paenibacillus cellulosilyticus]PWV95845.1 L-rhamnose mutarotase [Paenibacillus cellulosilyticus]QKS47721.1 L-rhamnose mutarotase [Paenibacillus cellulosilyticus]
MVERSLWKAVLKPDQVERYERLHNEQPAAIAAQLHDKGFVNLNIYRSGLAVFMTWEIDPDRIIPDRIVREHAEREWDRLTGDCFAEGWTRVPLIYRLTDHSYKTTGLNDALEE